MFMVQLPFTVTLPAAINVLWCWSHSEIPSSIRRRRSSYWPQPSRSKRYDAQRRVVRHGVISIGRRHSEITSEPRFTAVPPV